jgi:hypothetical protein
MAKSYIIVELAGGLGNQIFILEMAKYLASLNNGKILLETSHIDSEQFKGKSTIEDLVLECDVKLFKYNKLFKKLIDFFKQFSLFFNKFDKHLLFIPDESIFSSRKQLLENLMKTQKPKFVFLFGFWQNFSFWQNSSTYGLKNSSQKYLDTYQLMEDLKPIIFHYRIGSYGTKWEYQWGVLSPEFLFNSLAHLHPDKAVWIFSDNLVVAEEFFRKFCITNKSNLVYFDDSGMSPAEIFLLFSKSEYLVCSNSTFSIAAAKIGKVANVIAPTEFSKYEHIDLPLPDNWIRTESVWMGS